jgi:hypothetical protein
MVASTALDINFLLFTGGRCDTYFPACCGVSIIFPFAHDGLIAKTVNPKALFLIKFLLEVIFLFF